MSSHSNGNGEYRVIPDPVCVVFFTDKVIIIRADGEVIERELYQDVSDIRVAPLTVTGPASERGMRREYHDRMAKPRDMSRTESDVPADDDFQPGDS